MLVLVSKKNKFDHQQLGYFIRPCVNDSPPDVKLVQCLLYLDNARSPCLDSPSPPPPPAVTVGASTRMSTEEKQKQKLLHIYRCKIP